MTHKRNETPEPLALPAHPEPHSHTWTEQEKRCILAWGAELVARNDARNDAPTTLEHAGEMPTLDAIRVALEAGASSAWLAALEILQAKDAEIARLKAALDDASTLLKRTPRVCMDMYDHGDRTSFGFQAKAMVRAIDAMKGEAA